ncbi:hypothetical protein I6A60_18970 [Frankia sp. AgB1.9]|uniref:hypothetical protein n=1 Tax=unclassified Frankia TaxID=2632575 RepID=UPI00193280F6|nr:MULTISPECIES: hypothetical protein [unclassified Frankia]MBL7487879.1 hypothetical protein [Frankia sp. AgW1.1]MBL7549944.1 hypothetical protein [Frankia sp. AgB1.9]MBL7621477.1 hypothetical protein [Frankia sp. AgB1.8]
MLAILAGKLDPAGGTPLDRSEDALTGAVFGALRHLPYRLVLGQVLAAAGVDVEPEALDDAQVELWPTYPVPHLPPMRVEPDVVVTAGSTVVVFEAKYTSPFTIYPADERTGGEPFHQMAAQYAAVQAATAAKGWPDPIVVAVTVGAIPPTADLAFAARSARLLVSAVDADRFRWLPWHQIARCLQSDGLRTHECRLADDTLRFMDSREVRHVFDHLDLAAYAEVAQAQKTAATRLYPQLRLFFDALTAAVMADGFDHAQPTWKSMQFTGLSTSVAKPSEWARTTVGLAYWSTGLPARAGARPPSLVAAFDFYDPAFEVCLHLPSPTVAAALGKWQPHAAELARELGKLDGYDLVVDSPDPTGPVVTAPTSIISAAWIVDVFGRLSGTTRLRLRQRIPLDNITVEKARDLLLGLRAAIDQCPILWTMTTATGQTEPRPQP